MESTRIDVVIRTNGFSTLLFECVNCLYAQKGIRLNIIIVNSSPSAEGISCLGDGVEILSYTPKNFNYSEALNRAIPFLVSDFTLIISSHSMMRNPMAVAYGVTLMRSTDLVAAACFSDGSNGDLSHRTVDLTSFNGFNGTFNSATLYRTSMLRERPFRHEVLSAEDQEWSRWALEQDGMLIYHVTGCHCVNANPRRRSLGKLLKEWEFVSVYAYPTYLSLGFIGSQFKHSAALMLQLKVRGALFAGLLALLLFRVRLMGTYSKSSSY